MLISKELPLDDKYPKSCVYWIYHEGDHTDPRVSGYVGVCVNGAERRFKRHTYDSLNGSDYTVHRAMRKYGNKVKVKVIVTANPEFCLLVEAMLRPIAQMEGTWNMGAGGGTPMMGYIPTQEHRDKIGAATKGRVVSQEVRKKLSEAGKGVPFTESRKAAISLRLAEQPWNNPRSNHKNWAISGKVWEWLKSGEKQAGVLRNLGLHWHSSEFNIIFKKLKSGWCPEDDCLYQTWLSEYKQNKEAQDVT